MEDFMAEKNEGNEVAVITSGAVAGVVVGGLTFGIVGAIVGGIAVGCLAYKAASR
jgi:hypothetical protein